MTSPQTIMHLIRHLAQPRKIPIGELSKRAGMGETHLNMPRENKAGIATGTLTAYLRALEAHQPLTDEEERRLLGVLRGDVEYVPEVDGRKRRVDCEMGGGTYRHNMRGDGGLFVKKWKA